jgi:hypothetical protein
MYISDIEHWAEVKGIYGAFFSKVAVLPARAVVPVKELHYGAHIEIQAIAFLNRSSATAGLQQCRNPGSVARLRTDRPRRSAFARRLLSEIRWR